MNEFLEHNIYYRKAFIRMDMEGNLKELFETYDRNIAMKEGTIVEFHLINGISKEDLMTAILNFKKQNKKI